MGWWERAGCYRNLEVVGSSPITAHFHLAEVVHVEDRAELAAGVGRAAMYRGDVARRHARVEEARVGSKVEGGALRPQEAAALSEGACHGFR